MAFVCADAQRVDLNEIVIGSSYYQKKQKNVQVNTLDASAIEKIAPASSTDLLKGTSGIRVQSSQMGGGSPVIRGFEANRILLIIDGVRMNNAIYRSGHLQNSVTIHPSLLKKMEVFYGPSSVIYGSGAMGGAIHFYTKDPPLGNQPQKLNSNIIFSSVNDGLSTHLDYAYSSENWGTFTAITTSKFGDLSIGKYRAHGYKDWGKMKYYSANTEEIYSETPTKNDGENILKNTGYRQFDILQKFSYKPNKHHFLKANIQYSTSTNIPRTDALMDKKNGILKWAEWWYGPQKRLLMSVTHNTTTTNRWLKNINTILAYQNIKESRIQRKFGSLRREYRRENVHVVSLNTDARALINELDKFLYGVEITYNNVRSSSEGRELMVKNNRDITFKDSTFPVQTRYPDAGNHYATFSTYANYYKVFSPLHSVNFGTRFTAVHLNSKWSNQSVIQLPKKEISKLNYAIAGNINYAYNISKDITITGLISNGFRAPNIDDMAKVREKRGLLHVPNQDLKPEYAYNSELGIQGNIFKNLYVSTHLYYKYIVGYIIRERHKKWGDISENKKFLIDNGFNSEDVVTNINGDNAYIYGVDLSTSYKWNSIIFKGQTTYTYGRTIKNRPLPSIAPLFGKAEIEYTNPNFRLGLNCVYNGPKNINDFDIIGEVDNHRITHKLPNGEYAGTPAWYTLNFNIGFKLIHNITLDLFLENILDYHYIEFASGLSSPGRNFKFRVAAEL